MKFWKAGLVFLIAFLIQPSLLNMINIGGYTPNLLLCLTVIFTFVYGEEYYGPVMGAVFGLAYDLCFGDVIGPTPIALLITAVIVMQLRKFANVENVVSMMAVSLLSFVSYYLLNWILFKLAGSPLGIFYAFSYSLWVMLYSLAVITIVYVIMMRKGRKLHGRNRYY